MKTHVPAEVVVATPAATQHAPVNGGTGPAAITPPAPAGAGLQVDVLPTSFGQARLWFLDRLDPGGSAYVSDLPLRLLGAFDADAFEHGLNVVVARHEALRTRFAAVEGEPVQVVVPELSIAVERVDLRADADPLAAARALARDVAVTRFDLARGPLLRAVVARLGAQDQALLLTLHHIENASPFMCLLAAYGVLLHRWSGQSDLLVGTPVAGRTRADLDPLIGFFVNMLVLRLDLSGQPTFRELLGRVRGVALDAYSQQDIPFERLVSELSPERRLSSNPLFETTFALQTAGGPDIWPGLEVSHLAVAHQTVKFDLALTCVDAGGYLAARFTYAADLFDAQTVARMAEQYVTLLDSVARDPDTPIGRLPLLPPAERAVLEAANAAGSPVPGAPVHELFSAAVRRDPLAPAARYGGTVLSYRELDRRVGQLAAALTALGAAVPDRPVALLLDHGPDLVAAQLAVLTAGAAFLPLDVGTPARRVAAVLAAARPLAVLTTTEHAGLLPVDAPAVLLLDRDLPAAAEPGGVLPPGGVAPGAAAAPGGIAGGRNLAYLIATSGTTGTPRLVEIEHRSVVNYLGWFAESVAGDREVLIPALSSPAFDASVKA